MQLSDSVSLLLPVPSRDPVTFTEPPQDPEFFLDLKKHLNKQPDAIKERIEFHKKYPFWSIYRVRDEFAKSYSETYLNDVMHFARSNPHMNAVEAAQAFCSKYRGYLIVYGVELTERAFTRL